MLRRTHASGDDVGASSLLIDARAAEVIDAKHLRSRMTASS